MDQSHHPSNENLYLTYTLRMKPIHSRLDCAMERFSANDLGGILELQQLPRYVT